MTRWRWSAVLVVATVVGLARLASVSAQVASAQGAAAQGAPDLAGRWTFNRGLSVFPSEIGFGADWLSAGRSVPDSTPRSGGGGRGQRGGRGGASGGGTGGAFPKPTESQDDAQRVRQLTAEVRQPSAQLTIVDSGATITITNDREQSRTFHPDGREEALQLDGVPVDVTATRDAGRLIVVYRVEQGRELRYTYSRTATPAQLVVDVEFIERGGGDKVKLVYEPYREPETRAPAGSTPGETMSALPDAELRGLTKLGLVVEGLGAQAVACGLNQATLEAAVTKRLSDAGLKVLRNSDEDTYLYVNVMTASVSGGLCVSRYDASLYTHTTTKLSYQPTPVLVQVSLLHQGSIAGGPSAAHAADVLRGLQEYVDQFATRIRDANK